MNGFSGGYKPVLAYEWTTVNTIKNYKKSLDENRMSREEYEKEKNKTLKNRVYEEELVRNAVMKKNAFYFISAVIYLLSTISSLFLTVTGAIKNNDPKELLNVIFPVVMLCVSILLFTRKDKIIGIGFFFMSAYYLVYPVLTLTANTGGNLGPIIFYLLSQLSFISMGLGFILKGKCTTKPFAFITVISFLLAQTVNYSLVNEINLLEIALSVIFADIVIILSPVLAFSLKDKLPKQVKTLQAQAVFTFIESSHLLQAYSDLCSSGAISPQDFEKKKTSILSKTL